MECATAIESLSARLDGELSPDSEEALRAHLESCAKCRTAADEFSVLDRALRGELADHEAAARVQAGALQPVVAPTVQGGTGVSASGRRSVVMATLAATIAIAASIIALAWLPTRGIVPPKDSNLVEITLAKGTVNVLAPSSKEWQAVALPERALQPVGFQLQTEAMSLCEFRCPSGGVVRVDEQTELQVVEATQVAVSRGRIWCAAPNESSLTVVPSHSPHTAAFAATCQPASEMQTTVDPPASVRVFAARGPVRMAGTEKTAMLEAGQAVHYSVGEWGEPFHADALEATEWMLPLLAMRGGHDAEFAGHVTGLLSRIGTTKLSYGNEEQLVNLGGPGAIPLIAFLRDPASAGDPAKRIRAASIIARTAPPESLADLVELLNDNLAPVRVSAARALERLTGQDQGVPASQWNEQGEWHKAAVGRWREWLKRGA